MRKHAWFIVLVIVSVASCARTKTPIKDAALDRVVDMISSDITSDAGLDTDIDQVADLDAALPDAQADVSPSMPQICHSSKLCWENPIPQGNYINAVWAASSTSVWAVGARGLILHWDGSAWQRVDSNATYDLTGIWGLNDNDFYITNTKPSSQMMIHMINQVPHEVNVGVGYAKDVWGRAPNDIWVVGHNAGIAHWDGSSWQNLSQTQHTSESLLKVEGVGDQVWFSAANGTLLRYANGNFTKISTKTTATIYDIWGESAQDIWMAASGGAILHWDGSAITSSYPGTTNNLRAIWGDSPNSIWVAGDYGTRLYWNGSDWTSTTGGDSYYAIGGYDKNDLWFVGSNGRMDHYDGAVFTSIRQGEIVDFKALTSIETTSGTRVWAVGESGAIWMSTGRRDWVKQTSGTTENLNGVWALSETQAWAVGDNGMVVIWDGTSWKASSKYFGTTVSLTAISGHGNQVWAVGENGTVRYWNGSSWENRDADSSYQLSGIWVGPTTAWVAAEEDVLNWKNNSWEVYTDVSTSPIYALWANSESDDVWAVGTYGKINRWDGSAWSLSKYFVTNDHIRGIWGYAANDVWTCSDNGTMYHWDGTNWNSQFSGISSSIDLMAIHGNAKGFWVAGTNGAILRHQP